MPRWKERNRVVSVGITEWTEVHGGVAQLAGKTKFNRESLYKMLSERGNSELRSLDALLHALEFRLAVADAP